MTESQNIVHCPDSSLHFSYRGSVALQQSMLSVNNSPSYFSDSQIKRHWSPASTFSMWRDARVMLKDANNDH